MSWKNWTFLHSPENMCDSPFLIKFEPYSSSKALPQMFSCEHFWQVLTKPCRTSLIREHLSLNASWFSYARTQKNTFFEKLIRKKIQKNFIVNNNNNIHVWYLPFKWPSSRSIANHNTGTNVFKYCVLFCNKVDKMHLQ